MKFLRAITAAAGLTLALAAPAFGAEKVLRIATTAFPPSKGNPFYSTATTSYTFFTALFDSLTMIDDAGVVHPWLALEWTPINETTWHFKLRPNVTFSNGEPFNAFAVKTTVDFLLSPEGNAQTVGRDIEFIASTRVIDELTLEIVTKAPNILLPRYVSGFSVVAPKHFLAVGIDGFAQAPIGTGPFKVDDWGPEKVLLSAYRGSWRAPIIDKIEMLALPEPTTRTQAMETKRVDVATNLNPEDVSILEASGNRIHRRSPSRILLVALDNIKPDSPFKDVRVRQALNHAVNRQAIVDNLLGGLVEPASQPAIPTAIGYVPGLKPYAYDPVKARQLLNDAGYAKGLSFIVEFPSGQLANDTAIVQQIAADLAQVGVKMEIRTITFPQLVKNMTVGGWKGHALMTDFSTAPSLDMMRAFNRHSCRWQAPWYCDPSIQPTLDAAEGSFDIAERTALTQKAIQHYRDTAQGLFLYPALSLDGISSRVTRWAPWNDNFMYHLVDLKESK